MDFKILRESRKANSVIYTLDVMRVNFSLFRAGQGLRSRALSVSHILARRLAVIQRLLWKCPASSLDLGSRTSFLFLLCLGYHDTDHSSSLSVPSNIFKQILTSATFAPGTQLTIPEVSSHTTQTRVSETSTPTCFLLTLRIYSAAGTHLVPAWWTSVHAMGWLKACFPPARALLVLFVCLILFLAESQKQRRNQFQNKFFQQSQGKLLKKQ